MTMMAHCVRGEKKLVDMDWRFGVTAATSESHSDGSTFLQLKLVLENGAGEQERVYFELTLPQFYEFLATLESAKVKVGSLT
ncbi:COMM domain-containing protein 7 [Diplonema papillatum]|nr:COMM domain-containing protein 7 [Diplonema papillatum]